MEDLQLARQVARQRLDSFVNVAIREPEHQLLQRLRETRCKSDEALIGDVSVEAEVELKDSQICWEARGKPFETLVGNSSAEVEVKIQYLNLVMHRISHLHQTIVVEGDTILKAEAQDPPVFVPAHSLAHALQKIRAAVHGLPPTGESEQGMKANVYALVIRVGPVRRLIQFCTLFASDRIQDPHPVNIHRSRGPPDVDGESGLDECHGEVFLVLHFHSKPLA
mmetsp:Transcript_65269/g.164533  ORF Transcript_65269/g.164533 Transcript_65269/m.164533 type:complete len:223 (-) Transcript_65269:151-819(-)